ncbi:MAG: 50S ribosomal protein L4 [Candidatus Aenigmarchaeota archaeon]|nr:50S ribosomal protein L4 [Candidatus Aenigmarchaeota archaeon]
MEVNVLDLEGRQIGKIKLPKVFEEPVREDIVSRAVLSSQSNRRQRYSPDPMAGKRTSAHYHGTRRIRYSMMNKEMARLPRLHARTVPFLTMRARFVPQAVGGRRAHPPLVEREWEQKINRKERRKAIKSALAATSVRELVAKRGHQIQDIKELPLVVEDKLQELKKTKEVIKVLVKLGLTKELERISERKIRAGKGKSRGRKYKEKIGPLFVVTDAQGLSKAVKNITGCDVCKVENLSTEILAPGASLGRITIFSKSAIENLNKPS